MVERPVDRASFCGALTELLYHADSAMKRSFQNAKVWESGLGLRAGPTPHDIEMGKLNREVGGAWNSARNQVEQKMEDFGCVIPSEIAIHPTPPPKDHPEAHHMLTYQHARVASGAAPSRAPANHDRVMYRGRTGEFITDPYWGDKVIMDDSKFAKRMSRADVAELTVIDSPRDVRHPPPPAEVAVTDRDKVATLLDRTLNHASSTRSAVRSLVVDKTPLAKEIGVPEEVIVQVMHQTFPQWVAADGSVPKKR
jgi:hypothetical protein